MNTVKPITQRNVLALIGFMVCAMAAVALKDAPFPKPLLLGGALFGGIFILWKGLFRRDFMTYLLVAYLPFSKQISADFGIIPGLNLTNILVGVVTLFWLLEGDETEGPLLAKTPLNTPIFLFLSLGIFSVIRGMGYGFGYLSVAGIQYFRTWIVPLYLYFLMVNSLRSKEEIKNISLIIMMVTVTIGLMASYEYIGEDDRIGGVVDEPNLLSAFFNYYMFLPLGFFLLNMNQKKYWALLIPFLICFRGIMVTFSRAGYFAFAVSSYAITFFRSKLLFLLLIGATFIMVQNPAFLPEGVRYRLAQTIEKKSQPGSQAAGISEESLDKSTSDRIRLWRAAQEMIQDHPVFGVGYALFVRKVFHYWPGTEDHDPHNSYLLIAAEMGIPALLVFLWILWQVFWNTRSLHRTTQDPFVKAIALGFLGGLFGFLASNLFGSRANSTEISMYFWILCGLVMRLRMMEQQEKKTAGA